MRDWRGARRAAEERAVRRPDWAACGWGLVGGAAGAATILFIRGGLWGDPVAAAWVQALGSIAAVLAALFIATGQQRRDAARKHERQITLLTGAKIAASAAAAAIAMPHEVLKDAQFGPNAISREADLSSFSGAQALLQKFPIFELDDQDVILAMTRLSVMIGGSEVRMAYLIDLLRSGEEPDDSNKAELKSRAEMAAKLCATVFTASTNP